jgi:hypothetical protein
MVLKSKVSIPWSLDVRVLALGRYLQLGMGVLLLELTVSVKAKTGKLVKQDS